MRRMIGALMTAMALYLPLHGRTLIDHQWDFRSAADVEFIMQDTLKISVHFPDNIPDDRLIGYTRFRVTIADSNAGGAISGASFLYRILFDAGFLHFNHVLTYEMNYNSGLFAGRNGKPQKYRLYQDPYPVSRLHQWFPATTFTVDTARNVLRYTYVHHVDPTVPLAPAALYKTCPASSGYPFDYGLFYADSGSAVRYDWRTGHGSQPLSWDAHQLGQQQVFTVTGRSIARQTTGVAGLRYPSACFIARDQAGRAHSASRVLIIGNR